MRRTILLIGMSFFLWVALSPSALAGGKPIDLTVVYSNNINGKVRPCPT